MKFEITKDVIQGMIDLFSKDQAIKELQAAVNVIILKAVEEAIADQSAT